MAIWHSGNISFPSTKCGSRRWSTAESQHDWVCRTKLCPFNRPTNDLRNRFEWRPERLCPSFTDNVYIRSQQLDREPTDRRWRLVQSHPPKRSWRILLSDCKFHLHSCLQRAISRSWHDPGEGPGISQLSLVRGTLRTRSGNEAIVRSSPCSCQNHR